jgi:hypothetical protein
MNGFSARSVQPSRWDEAIFLMIPATSCLATIVLSLRDKIHSTAEALLKLALMWVEPWAESYSPFFGATNLPKAAFGELTRIQMSPADLTHLCFGAVGHREKAHWMQNLDFFAFCFGAVFNLQVTAGICRGDDCGAGLGNVAQFSG